MITIDDQIELVKKQLNYKANEVAKAKNDHTRKKKESECEGFRAILATLKGIRKLEGN